ncbi:MAG: two-component system LytT family response regulator [Rhodothermales bacterium]|jgi:two-component system LytT family response regulator
MNPLRVLIVDDEPLGRERIRSLLAPRSEVVVTGEASDGEEAVELLTAGGYDLVFLDIQMPFRSGFEVVEAVGVSEMPPVVFVTAYDQYALKAFDVHAIDYLLKPFEPSRFYEALARAIDRARGGTGDDWNRRVGEAIGDVLEAGPPATRLMVKERNAIHFVRVEDVRWVEASGNYVKLHCEKKDYLIRQTMVSIERRLDSQKFIRIHRSTIVNLDCIRDLRPTFNGEYQVRLTNGE